MIATQSDNIIRFPGEVVVDADCAVDVDTMAMTWLARLTSGTVTNAQLIEFEFWRAASHDHHRAYARLEAMWDGLGARPVVAGEQHAPAARHQPGRMRQWATGFGRLAAAILVMAMVAQYISVWRYDYHTAAGEMRRIALADGSTVYLKGGTALNAHVGSTGARTIDLARGEAFFEVRHDAARPFTVRVGDGVVRDVGTGFSVTRTRRATTVAVEHGAVAVAGGGLSTLLTPGRQVSFDLYAMGREQSVNKGSIAAWRRGLYVAEGKPLGDVLSDLDEYRSGRIIVVSPTLAAHRVNAVVQLARVDDWLDALGQTRGVAVHRWGPFTVVSDG